MASELLTCIKDGLASLNKNRGGDRDFEKLCEELIPLCIDSNFIPSSGSDNGGDGGIDGWSLLGDSGAIKYAFSIDKKTKTKLKSELQNCIYNKIRFFTNQEISQKSQEDIKNSFPDKEIYIYDNDTVAKFIEKNEFLGKYINLKDKQHQLDIAYIKNHPQYTSADVEHLIPRSVSYLDDNGELKTELLETFIEKSSDFIILHAQAGYGKTKCLVLIYDYVLNNQFKGVLPPVFVSLSNYIGNNFADLINDAQPSIPIEDCLLLLDGFDEMDYRFRESFIKELNSFVLANKSYNRKVIISSRTLYYEKLIFKDYSPVEVELCPLNDDDILNYVRLKIEPDKQNELLANKFFNHFKYNAFYLEKIIEYYAEHGYTVDSIPNLFKYLCKKEIELISRESDNDEIEKYESLALYMVINQKNSECDEATLNEFDITNVTKVIFSHKNILEYLAAEKICKQNDFETIKHLLFSNNSIVPYMINVFGFVLNILLSTKNQYELFESVLDYQVQSRNALSLLQIESDKISSEMNYSVLDSIMKSSNKMSDFRDHVKDVSEFFMNGDLSKNFELLINCLENYNDNKNYFASYLLLNLVINYNKKIDEYVQERIYKLFKSVLKENQNFTFIESLFYSVCKLSVCRKYAIEYDDNSERLMQIVYKNNKFYDLVDCLVNYIKSCGIAISSEQYLKLYKLLIHILTIEDSNGVEDVPNQIEMDKVTTFHHIIFFVSFIKFSDEYFTNNPYLFWEILTLISTEPTVKIDSNAELRDYYGMLSKHIAASLRDVRINEERYGVLLSIFLNSPSAFDNHYLWNEFNQSVPFEIGIKFVKDILIKTSANFMHYHFLINYCLLAIQSEKDFDIFYKEFNVERNQILKYFYNDYCLRINEKDAMYDYVFSKMDLKLQNKREQYKAESSKYRINFNERHLIKAKDDYHIIFDESKIKSQADNLFTEIGCNGILSNSVFLEHVRDDYENPEKPMINEFIDYWFRNMFRSSDEIKLVDIEDSLRPEMWKYNFAINLILFMNGHNIEFKDLNSFELKKIKDWVKYILDTYPLKTVDAKLLQVHRFLSYILRQADFLFKDASFCEQYAEKLQGLIFSGFSSVVDGMWYYEYSYYSLEYLERFLSQKQIIKFIIDNLDKVSFDANKAIAVFGYLSEHKNILSGVQENLACKKIAEYIHSNLTKNEPVRLFDYAYEIGFKITMIPQADLENALVLSENKDRLISNFAYNLMFENRFLGDDEKDYFDSILHHKFYNAKDLMLQKIAAEWIICTNKSADDVFDFYVDYLLNDNDKPVISSMFAHSVMCTEQIIHLPKIMQIFDYIKDKNIGWENQFCYYLNNMVMNSFKAMAKKANSTEFKQICEAVNKCAEDVPYYESLLKEISDEFATRNYIPVTVEEIKGLK